MMYSTDHKVQDQLIKYCSANLFLAIFMTNLPNQRMLLLPGLIWNPIEDQVVPLCRTVFRVRLKQSLFGLRSGNAFWNFLHHTLFASKSYIFSSTCSRLVVTYRISDILHEKNLNHSKLKHSCWQSKTRESYNSSAKDFTFSNPSSRMHSLSCTMAIFLLTWVWTCTIANKEI